MYFKDFLACHNHILACRNFKTCEDHFCYFCVFDDTNEILVENLLHYFTFLEGCTILIPNWLLAHNNIMAGIS